MKYIKPFNKFSINEEYAIGLADATLIYDEFLLKMFEKHLDIFLQSDDEKYLKKEEYSKDNISDIIDNPKWPKFPISSIICEFDMKRMSNEAFCKKYPVTSKLKDYNPFGACYNISEEKDGSFTTDPINDRSDVTIHLRLELGVLINKDKFNESSKEDLMVDVESTITHEFNHAYEGWMRRKSNKGDLPTDITWSVEKNRSKIKTELWKKWYDKVSYYLYWSEPHEMNAMIQETWPFVKKYDFEEMKKKSSSWRYAEAMEKFDAVKFKNDMVRDINNIYPDADAELILRRLKSGFANELIELGKESGKSDKPSIRGEIVKKMTIDRFLKYVEERSHYAAKRIKSRIIKMYGLKK